MRSSPVLAAVLVLAMVSLSLAQLSTFAANFQVRRPAVPNYGVVTGRITYDFPGLSYRLDYTGRNYSEILKFRANYGKDDRDTVDQWIYQTGSSCQGGCRASRVDFAFPVYVRNMTYYNASTSSQVINGVTCFRHVPLSSYKSNVTAIWFTATQVLCRAQHADGAEYTFTSVASTAITNVTFSEPADCLCGDKLDLIMLVDRSASQSRKDYDKARTFARTFARKFNLSPAQVHAAIAHFDVGVELVMDLYEGTSLYNIDAAVNAMDCACADTLDPKQKGAFDEVGNPNGVCCGRRTSISAALDGASLYLKNNGRAGSRKAVLVISDGKHNTMADGTPCSQGNQCNDDLAAAITRLKTAHPTSEIYGVGSGNSDHDKMSFLVGGRYHKLCNTSDAVEERNFYLVGSVGCSEAVYYCDPNTCGGICECADCQAPSFCDPTGDYCNVNTLSVSARLCEPCSNGNKCQSPYCNTSASQCQFTNVACPAVQNPACFTRTCNVNTGICATSSTGARGCTNECATNSDCNDNNLCTTDTCVLVNTAFLCQYTPVVCDDGNKCTIDFCTDPTAGCQTRPKPLSDCDDHVSCTVDTCMPDFGCRNTPITCNDNLPCTEDRCDLDLGKCVYEPILCPISSNNCTLNYCMYGGCDSRSLCPQALLVEPLGPGPIAGISLAAIAGVAALAAAGYVAYRIFHAPKKETSGGSASDFASE